MRTRVYVEYFPDKMRTEEEMRVHQAICDLIDKFKGETQMSGGTRNKLQYYLVFDHTDTYIRLFANKLKDIDSSISTFMEML